MLVPRTYREPRTRWTAGFTRRKPSALLMTHGGDADGPYGPHPPAVPAPRLPAGGQPDLTGRCCSAT